MKNEDLRLFFNNYKNKDKKVYTEFYEKFYSTVKNISLSFVKNYDDAEDITDIVFIKIYKMDKSNFPINNEMGWLYKVIKNTAIDFIRKNKPTVNIDELYSLETKDDYISELLDKNAYYDKIKKLPKTEQEIISLKIISNLTFKEIGKLLNIPSSTVSWIYYKSLKTLKIMIGELILIFAIMILSTTKDLFKSKRVDLVDPMNVSNDINNVIVHTNSQNNFIIFILPAIIVCLIIFLYLIFIFLVKNNKKNRK